MLRRGFVLGLLTVLRFYIAASVQTIPPLFGTPSYKSGHPAAAVANYSNSTTILPFELLVMCLQPQTET